MKTKMIAAAALAACVFALAGCGDDAEKAVAGAVAEAVAPVAREYEPNVPANATIAMLCRNTGAKSITSIKKLCVKAFEENISFSEKKELDDFLAKFGLDKAEPKWFLAGVGGVKIADLVSDKVPDFFVVASVDHDIDRLGPAIEETADKENGESIVKTEIAGVAAWTVRSPDLDGVKPCFASLDGTLLLAASDLSVLSDLVKLYRDGEGASDAFSALSCGKDEVVRLFAPDFGGFVKAAVEGEEDSLAMVDMFVPDGSRILTSLKEIDLSISADDNGATLRLGLRTGAAEDAEILRTLAKAALLPMKANLKDSPDPDDQLAFKFIDAIDVAGENDLFKVVMPVPAEALDSAVKEAEALCTGDSLK